MFSNTKFEENSPFKLLSQNGSIASSIILADTFLKKNKNKKVKKK